MLCLQTEGPYASGLPVTNLSGDETIHESKAHHSVTPSSVSVLVSQFVSDGSLSESKKILRFGNVSTDTVPNTLGVVFEMLRDTSL
jgi:hypothetical protein